MEQVKTVVLLASLTILFVFVGGYAAGSNGALMAFLLAAGINFYAYYYSDQQVLKHYNAVLIEDKNHRLKKIVQNLTYKSNLPMPKIYIIPDSVPNAFATGRNHENAAVAVTQGLLELLNEKEIEAVIAHELSHIKHYDILIGTIAATFAGAIAMLATVLQFSTMAGENKRGVNPIIMIVIAIVLPIAAGIIQMTVSRSREYIADEGAARMTGDAKPLQSALAKLEGYAKTAEVHNATEQTAHMFIINPFSGHESKFSDFFRTHPTTQDRIARLEELKAELK